MSPDQAGTLDPKQKLAQPPRQEEHQQQMPGQEAEMRLKPDQASRESSYVDGEVPGVTGGKPLP